MDCKACLVLILVLRRSSFWPIFRTKIKKKLFSESQSVGPWRKWVAKASFYKPGLHSSNVSCFFPSEKGEWVEWVRGGGERESPREREREGQKRGVRWPGEERKDEARKERYILKTSWFFKTHKVNSDTFLFLSNWVFFNSWDRLEDV